VEVWLNFSSPSLPIEVSSSYPGACCIADTSVHSCRYVTVAATSYLKYVTSAKYTANYPLIFTEKHGPWQLVSDLAPPIATSITLFARLVQSGTNLGQTPLSSITQSGLMGACWPSIDFISCHIMSRSLWCTVGAHVSLLTVTGRLSLLAPWITMLEQTCMVYSSP
jgi:hypothetical protein